MKIAIFCSAYCEEEKYFKAAEKICGLLAEGGCDLIFGASNVSLMKCVADEFEKKGRKIYGYTIPAYAEYSRPNMHKHIVCQTTAERKERMILESEGVLVLPGGIGTLDELGDALELKKQEAFKFPIVVLNTDGFWDGLKIQLQKAEEKSFLPKNTKLGDLVTFEDTPEEALKIFQ